MPNSIFLFSYLYVIILMVGDEMFNTVIPLYSICLLIGLILNAFLVVILSKRYNYPIYLIVSLLIFENVGIFLGGKILAFFQEYELYNGIFNILKVGVSAYGGLIGSIIAVIIFSHLLNISLQKLMLITMPSIPLVYSVGKIGCFFAGCCYGINYNGFGSIVYKYSLIDSINGISLFPVQLVESIIFFIIFIYILYRYKKYDYNMKTIGIMFFLCSMSKFILYYFRMNHVNSIFSLNQILCILFMIIGLNLYLKKENFNRSEYNVL